MVNAEAVDKKLVFILFFQGDFILAAQMGILYYS